MLFSVAPDLRNRSGIYTIRCTINSAIYIGATLNFRERYAAHLSTLKSHKHSDRQLQRAVDDWGIDNFSFEVVEVYTDTTFTFRELEQAHMDRLASDATVQLLNTLLKSNFSESRTTASSVVRPVAIPKTLMDKAMKRAAEMGFGFPEYVRHLIANDTKDVKLP